MADEFRRLLASSLGRQEAALKGEVDLIPGQIAELSRRLAALDRRLPVVAHRLEGLRAKADVDAFARAELDRLRGLPGVHEVGIDGSAVAVLTDPCHIAWQGTTYELGSYRVVLDLDGDVRVDSLDGHPPKPAWGHPHVQDGLPCLGNLREGVLKLVAEYELALATQVLLDFLSSYQPETAYTPIEGWPRQV